ncbi:NADPH-dependent oxidoreductase [Parabacteroides sp. FAFU027]|uniref:NADPH-dependent oxidoreductase n=1 Tax=Parabacteroides sp. FAFU027 TaxID=2922715 RepID=UPI001FAF759E|nr:NADPH-dependent oxidoreductase [Parabacteroides sp. FAFU027]
MLDVLKNRRTVRKYTAEPISESLLNELLESACRASTTGNMQLYSIIATTSDEVKAELSPLHFNQPMIKQAPLVLTFCADFNRFVKWCEARNAVPGYDNFQGFVTAAIDALLVAQTFCVAAEAKGLGVCYIGTVAYTTKAINKVLNLPKLVVPLATITVGYPDGEPAQVERLPLAAVLHKDRYVDYTPEDIERYYKDKEALPANQKFVEENKKENLAQVFTDVRYTKDTFDKFSKELLEAVREQGYNF